MPEIPLTKRRVQIGVGYAALVVVGAVHCTSLLGAGLYPSVQPLRTSLDIPDVSKANVSLIIRSASNGPLHFLDCHSAGYTGDPNFEYSGDFECRLSSVAHNDSYSTLLTEDANQEKDWESRARFFSVDLRPPCAEIPDFGATRSFELRGMKLVLHISDARFDAKGNVSALVLNVRVEPNPAASGEIAKTVQLPRTAPKQCGIDRYFPDPRKFGK